ncbi:MAG TPA: BACON domain-containing carbohydrate-binding protein, partial [Prolixibacteraceae bacterium]|nr:BACON domain-containing carbohydrate-binding protein [Prolixibacteraceae bacterium]
WNMHDNVAQDRYIDSSLYAFNGATASEYCYLFTPPYKGEFLDIIIAEIREKIIGWYDFYQFDKPVNTEYEVLRHDTAIVYSALGMNIDVDIITRVVGKRNADENVETGLGTFNAKKFSYNIIITAYLHIFGDVAEIVFADFPVIHWITSDKWIVKEWRPTVITTDALEFVGINSITAPGLDRTLTGYTAPKPVTPTLNLPQNNSSNVSKEPTLQWNQSNLADIYFLQIATDMGFTNVVYEDSTISANSKEISGLSAGTNYYWKVKAKNSNGISNWSDTWNFSTEEDKFLNVDKTNVSVSASEGSTTSLAISSNTEWTVASDQTWLTINPLSATGNKTISLTANKNNTINPRSATISIASQGLPTKTVTVTQDAGAATLDVSSSNLTIESTNGSTTNFSVTSNTSWNASSDQSWLSLNPPSGNGNLTVVATAEANLTTSSRSGTIFLSAPGTTSKSISVTQAAGAATLKVSTTSINIGAMANSSSSVTITSNTSWDISSDQPWLEVSPENGVGNQLVTLVAQENPTILNRTATITISPNGTASKTITVTQASGSETLLLSTSAITFEATEGSSSVVNVISNTGWSVSVNEEWLTATPSTGSGNGSLTIVTTENSSTIERTATVTVTIEGTETKQIVAVTQKGASPMLVVSDYSLTIGALEGSTAQFTIASNTSWNISSTSNWLSTNIVAGESDQTVVLTATKNPSSSERTATIIVTAEGVAQKTLTITQSIFTASERLFPKNVKIYPNPFSEGIYIDSSSDNAHLLIADINGHIVFEAPVSGVTYIPLENLRNGIYHICFIENGQSHRKTLIKK